MLSDEPSLVAIALYINTKRRGGGYLKALIYYFLCGYSVYYFIALIIECYLLAPFLVRHNNKITLLLVASLSIVTGCVFDYLRFIEGCEFPLIISGSFFKLSIFFFIGIYLARHSRDYSLWIPIAMIITGYLLGIAEMHGVYELHKTTQVGQKVSLYLYDAGIILLTMSSKIERLYRENMFTSMVLYIGEISFGVYFTHVYFIFMANYFFPSIRGNWFLFWAFSLITTITFIAIVKRLSPSLSRRYLGYR